MSNSKRQGMVKIITCLNNGTAHISFAKRNPDLPSYTENTVGSGRTYITPSGTQFIDRAQKRLETWSAVNDFVPPRLQRSDRPYVIVVSESNAFALARSPYSPKDRISWVDRATADAARVAMVDAVKVDKKGDYTSIGSLIVMALSGVAIFIMAVLAVLVFFRDDSAPVDPTETPNPISTPSVSPTPVLTPFVPFDPSEAPE